MQISFFSFFMSIVWSSVLIIAIYLCRKKRFFIYQFGVMSPLLLYIFCVVRMTVPFEFEFTRGLPSGDTFSTIYKSIKLDNIGTSGMSILSVLLFIWILISAVLILRFAHQYYIAMRRISTYVIREDEQCKKMYERVINHSKKKMNINVRCSGDVNIPIGIGIFDKSIVLPDESYSDQELYWILSHEYTHFLNRDLLVKMLIHIFCCVFWWNPVVCLLKRDLNQALEIKCDLCVTEQMNNHNKAEYLTTIVSILKKTNAKKEKTILQGTTELVSKDGESEIIERFRIVSESHKLQSKNKFLAVMWLSAFVLVLIFSYSFVVVPCYEAPVEEIETGPNAKEIRSDNSYIIKNKNGTYTIVMSGNVRQNIDEEVAFEMETQGFRIIEEEE